MLQLAKMDLVPTKAKRESTQRAKAELRNKINQYCAVLIHEQLAKHFTHEGSPSREHCLVFDPHTAECVSVFGRLETQVKRLESACREILGKWDSIQPPSDFDG